jgi:hypothetical protein
MKFLGTDDPVVNEKLDYKLLIDKSGFIYEL